VLPWKSSSSPPENNAGMALLGGNFSRPQPQSRRSGPWKIVYGSRAASFGGGVLVLLVLRQRGFVPEEAAASSIIIVFCLAPDDVIGSRLAGRC
jgi:hypothetical protein